MTNAMETGVPWIATGAVVMFLIVCAWCNRRAGYHRMRGEKITLGEAMARIRQSLALRHHALPVADSGLEHPMAQTEQLLSLSSILEYRQQTAASQPEEVVELHQAEIVTAHK
ncbi:MAG TPA: hypothetical protein VHY84_18745 [Bryobacteraceae bacterium]|nr:hypothetical protein [Bryobacteraceae bacterium]